MRDGSGKKVGVVNRVNGALGAYQISLDAAAANGMKAEYSSGINVAFISLWKSGKGNVLLLKDSGGIMV